MKKISILLTKYSDSISSFLYFIGGFGYTHASLSLEHDPDTYYSFNYKGFAVETVHKHRQRGVKRSICYHIQVSDSTYLEIQNRIQMFQESHDQYRYTRLGLLFCILHIPFRWKQHYFCSQFVAELLTLTEEIPLRKTPCLYLPNQFRAELEQLPQLCNINLNLI